MTEPVFDKNIPIPPRSESMKWITWLRKARSGWSFVIPCDKQTRLLTAAKYYGIPVTTRKENGVGLRVWKVAEPKKK